MKQKIRTNLSKNSGVISDELSLEHQVLMKKKHNMFLKLNSREVEEINNSLRQNIWTTTGYKKILLLGREIQKWFEDEIDNNNYSYQKISKNICEALWERLWKMGVKVVLVKWILELDNKISWYSVENDDLYNFYVEDWYVKHYWLETENWNVIIDPSWFIYSEQRLINKDMKKDFLPHDETKYESVKIIKYYTWNDELEKFDWFEDENDENDESLEQYSEYL